MASEEHMIKMQAGASVLDDLFNGEAKGPDKKIGFILITFPFEGEDRRCSVLLSRDDIRPQLVPILETLIDHVDEPGVTITHAKYDS